MFGFGNSKRLLTGLQPSGALHIGNYFGVLKPFADVYSDYESFLLIVDYHALTTVKNPKELSENIVNVVKDYIGIGIDPKKALIFKQSDVSEHTELGDIGLFKNQSFFRINSYPDIILYYVYNIFR